MLALSRALRISVNPADQNIADADQNIADEKIADADGNITDI